MELWKIHFLVLIMMLDVIVTAEDIVLVTDLINGTIWAGPIDTLELEEIPLENVVTPVAIDYDPVEHKVYWTDVQWNTINRASLDGTSQETVLAYLSVPDGITIDVESRHMYWTDTGTDKIERANLDGSERMVVLQEDHDQPRAIVVDSIGSRLFWTDWGSIPKIERANTDGSERVTLVDTNLHLPNGLAVDFTGNRLYWCDAGLNIIETTDLDGGNRFNLFLINDPDIHPFDVGIYNNDIYWSDWEFKKLIKMNRYVGREAEAVGPAVFQRAGGLHIYKDTTNECSSNPCLNGGQCVDEVNRYLCICESTGFEGQSCEIDTNECQKTPAVCHVNAKCANTYGSFTCQCSDGFYADGNGNTCIDKDECQQTPCDRDADCINTVGSFTCQCRPGFAGDGKICNEINECTSYPCLNDGRCFDQINSFDCECPNGYNGDRCQYTYDDPCSSLPCENKGTCLSDEDEEGFTCQCQAGYTGDTCQTEIPVGCNHPGNLENGYVLPDRGEDVFPAGKKIEYVCMEGYTLKGPKETYCTSDFTWSYETEPVCVPEEGGTDNTLVVAAGGGAGGIIILILVIILIFVCCKKGSARNDLPNFPVHYTTELPPAPKDDGTYNMAFDGACHMYSSQLDPRNRTELSQTLRNPAPLPRPLNRELSNHIYDDLKNIQGAGGAGSFHGDPPAYIDVIDNKAPTDENAESPYTDMKSNVKIHRPNQNNYEHNNI